ncbi:hypothetical protein ACIRSU_16590 [Streptomyces sp. NPDC101160]|uniref:RCC1 domain-containing protein n=1 Tax=Streptomyces sp. NPDC101160 TaxID=3366118 RepID=UPI0037F72B85
MITSRRLLPSGRSTYVHARSVRTRIAALGAAALLMGGLAPAAAGQGARAADGRPTAPAPALAWGTNNEGRLGDGTTVDFSTTPVRVCGSAPCLSSLDDVVSVDAGVFHSVALRADGTVWTWGDNFDGALGDGTTNLSMTPVQVCAVGATAPCGSFLTGVIAVSAGHDFTLALRANGTVVAWGNNIYGQLGTGNTSSYSAVPVPVGNGNTTQVTAISAGGDHSLALRADGTVQSWGRNDSGQLGNGTTTDSAIPVAVCAVGEAAPCHDFLFGVTAVSAGDAHSLALATDGTVASWGDNSSGQLGNGTTTSSSSPVQVSGLTAVRSIGAGYGHSLAARTDSTVRAWGNNDSGQLGNGTTTSSTVPVQACAPGTTAPCATVLTGIATVSAGYGHSLAMRTDGTVRSWGANYWGQLGDGTTTQRSVPVRVCAARQTAPCTQNLDGVGAISAGGGFSLATSRPSADVAIALKSSPNPVAANGNLTYTVTVKNNGPSAAENVTFDDSLPAEGEFVSASPSQGSCVVPPTGSTDTVTCKLGTLGPNTSQTATIVVTVRADAGTTVANTATVTSTTADPNQVNNSVTVRTRVG